MASLFYFLWITAFILAATQFVQVCAVASWYFTENAAHRGDFSLSRGYWWLWRYNLGSVLFGSFLLALIWFIRIIFEYIAKKLQRDGDDPMAQAVKCVVCVVRCCLDCFNRFIKYLNATAYCQIAITGENFCTAAMNGAILYLKNGTTFSISAGLVWIFNILGKLTISTVNCIFAYLCIAYMPQLEIKVNSPIGPLIVVALYSYLIATLFMSLYSDTALCMLHCFHVDLDICKQKSYDETIGMNRPREMQQLHGDLSGKEPLMK